MQSRPETPADPARVPVTPLCSTCPSYLRGLRHYPSSVCVLTAITRPADRAGVAGVSTRAHVSRGLISLASPRLEEAPEGGRGGCVWVWVCVRSCVCMCVCIGKERIPGLSNEFVQGTQHPDRQVKAPHPHITMTQCPLHVAGRAARFTGAGEGRRPRPWVYGVSFMVISGAAVLL